MLIAHWSLHLTSYRYHPALSLLTLQQLGTSDRPEQIRRCPKVLDFSARFVTRSRLDYCGASSCCFIAFQISRFSSSIYYNHCWLEIAAEKSSFHGE
jgi:hypothetical protein